MDRKYIYRSIHMTLLSPSNVQWHIFKIMQIFVLFKKNDLTHKTQLYLPQKSLSGLLLQRPEHLTSRLSSLELSAMENIFRQKDDTTSCSLRHMLFLQICCSSLTSIKTLRWEILWKGSERKESRGSRWQHGSSWSLFKISSKRGLSFLTKRNQNYVNI